MPVPTPAPTPEPALEEGGEPVDEEWLGLQVVVIIIAGGLLIFMNCARWG